MRLPTRHQWLVAVVGVFLAVGLVLTSVWLMVRHDGGEGTAPSSATAAPATMSPYADTADAAGHQPLRRRP